MVNSTNTHYYHLTGDVAKRVAFFSRPMELYQELDRGNNSLSKRVGNLFRKIILFIPAYVGMAIANRIQTRHQKPIDPQKWEAEMKGWENLLPKKMITKMGHYLIPDLIQADLSYKKCPYDKLLIINLDTSKVPLTFPSDGSYPGAARDALRESKKILLIIDPASAMVAEGMQRLLAFDKPVENPGLEEDQLSKKLKGLFQQAQDMVTGDVLFIPSPKGLVDEKSAAIARAILNPPS